MGLSKDISKSITLQTFLGAVKGIEENIDTQNFINMIATKDGATQKGLEQLESYNTKKIFQSAIESSYKKIKSLN